MLDIYVSCYKDTYAVLIINLLRVTVYFLLLLFICCRNILCFPIKDTNGRLILMVC